MDPHDPRRGETDHLAPDHRGSGSQDLRWGLDLVAWRADRIAAPPRPGRTRGRARATASWDPPCQSASCWGYCTVTRAQPLGFAKQLLVSVWRHLVVEERHGRGVSRGPWRDWRPPVESSPAACGRRGLRGVGVRRAFWTFLNLSAHARLSCAAELINNGVRTAWLVYALSIDDAIMCLSFVQLLL